MTQSGRKSADLPWYKDGLAFECTQCGGCCSGAPGFVWVEDWEVQAMAAKMGMQDDLDGFERQFVRQVENRRSLVEYPDGDCIFLDPQTRGCIVYEARPIQCRTWPFWGSNLETSRTWAQTSRSCPGCNHGKLYQLEHIEKQRDARDM